MKVAIVSHSYLDFENRKNIHQLSKLCSVQCILPQRGSVLISRVSEIDVSRDRERMFFTSRPINVSAGQYLLATMTMGFDRFQPDIINIEYNPWSALFLQVLLFRRLFVRRAKIVCTIKKNTFQCPPGLFGKVKGQLARFCLAKVDHVIAASTKAANMVSSQFSFPVDKISVCPHLGVDITLFRPASAVRPSKKPLRRAITVGYCGRFDAEKGVEELVEAVRLANRALGNNLVLRMLGRGTEKGSVEDLLRLRAERLGWLELLSPVPHTDVPGFLQSVDIFVMPSRRLPDHEEHDAQALIEAMASGIASIGTTTGIIPEILVNNAGRLVEPEDPHELCNTLLDLVERPVERRRLSARARDVVRRYFALNVVAERKNEIFRQVLDE